MTDKSQSHGAPDHVLETSRIAEEARNQLANLILRVKGELQDRTETVQQLSTRVDVLEQELGTERESHRATALQRDSLHHDYEQLAEAHNALRGEFQALLQTVDAACTGFDGEDALMGAALSYSENSRAPGETPDFAPASVERLIKQVVTNNIKLGS
ncbi:hypothetical protein [Roseibium sp. RKSG952]|uniref:hypothetical protein n=1 Tax=Roseibium sp. RKSG952 TaxID=2529384 RepID=UPI0012BD3B49|nr:hypothetical protein [Roseibium sp. RKSG952]MTH96623.1 hypothetical protein [Roseibium sp. RKSG952]